MYKKGLGPMTLDIIFSIEGIEFCKINKINTWEQVMAPLTSVKYPAGQASGDFAGSGHLWPKR